MSWLSKVFGRREDDVALALYHAVVAQARQPHWYEAGGVPDTIDGRFDMIAAILSLVLLRLERDPAAAAGASARLTADPFASLTTVTYQIVQLLTGDQEFDSPKTLSAFALGLVLFCITFALNIVALRVVRRFREAYE